MPPSLALDADLPLERQLLSQLGRRLRDARKARGMTGVEMARQLGVSRTTLQAVEQGEPSPSMGIYLRVMSVLGIVGDLALLATGESRLVVPPPPADLGRHGAQDYQSLLMHIEAVRLLQRSPALVTRALATLDRWRETADPRSLPLMDDWASLIAARDWTSAVADTERGRQLRQASPLATLLPPETRLAVIERVRTLKARSHAAASA